MSCCGQAMLHGRRVWIVELNATELRRADAHGHAVVESIRRRGLGDTSDGLVSRDDEMVHDQNELGAQGALVVGKVLGVRAPLDLGTFSGVDIPPRWSVKTQQSSSKDMADGYLRLRGRDRIGLHYVLVERDVAMWGGFVFIVHGWIAEARAREVSVQRYSYSSNRFVHKRHLEPLTRELYDTVHGAPTDEPPAPAPHDTDPDAQLGLEL